MMGLKTVGICDIYQTVCASLDCPAQTSQTCKPDVCPELSDEEKLLETEIKSGKYNEQELIDLVMFHILKDDELKVESEEEGEDPFLVDPNFKKRALRAVAKILQKKYKLP